MTEYRVHSPVEIDFETGESVQTLESQLSLIAERLRAIRNPWTGNKRKLITDIFGTIDRNGVRYDSFLDLFSGSCMVGLAAKLLGKRVVSNDVMKFPYLAAQAFVENHQQRLSAAQKSMLFIEGEPSAQGWVNNRYDPDRRRFTEREARLLDAYRHNAWRLFKKQPNRCDKLYALAMVHMCYHVMDHCFVGGRLNKGQVLADVDHRLAHARNEGREMPFHPDAITWVDMQLRGERHKHRAYNYDAVELLREIRPEVELCYVDPPYGGSQSDYGKMYAFFEGYVSDCEDATAESDECSAATQKFVRPSGYHDHFSQLLDAAGYIPNLVFSYNDSSWCSIEDIRAAIGKCRKRVCVTEVEYPYNYRDRKSQSKEFIIVAE